MDLGLISFDRAISSSPWDLGLDAVWRHWPGLPKNGEQTVVDKQPGMIPLANVNTMVQLAVGDKCGLTASYVVGIDKQDTA